MNNPYETGRFAQVTGVDQVHTHTDVARVVAQMLTDLQAHPTAWENHTLDRFLEALAASLRDLPGLYANRGDEFPDTDWKIFAEALIMASGYE